MPGGGQTDFRCYSDSKAIGSAEELKCKVGVQIRFKKSV